ncbi:hypothetical protein [Aerococcus tenax]|uniref:hypothetical protein n=1 Tax=Aerococcus tenax TaxID=3078812 RepID=UPI0018A78329|nr:hypothetical protein [Aerococcus tenax]
MKGKISLLLIASLALTACAESNTNQGKASSSSESEQSQEASSASTEQTSTSSTSESSSQESSDETKNQEKPEQSQPAQDPKAQYQAEEYQESKEYPGYTNKEVEMVRVWLSVMENTDLFSHGNDGDHIAAFFLPAGSSVNLDPPSVSPSWPHDIWSLSMGKTMAGTAGFEYSSNYNGTVTIYQTPHHWQGSQEENAAVAQEVLNHAFVLPVKPYSPSQVQPLLDTLEVRN